METSLSVHTLEYLLYPRSADPIAHGNFKCGTAISMKSVSLAASALLQVISKRVSGEMCIMFKYFLRPAIISEEEKKEFIEQITRGTRAV